MWRGSGGRERAEEILRQGIYGPKEQDTGWMEAKPASRLQPCPIMAEINPWLVFIKTLAPFSSICTLEDSDNDTSM